MRWKVVLASLSRLLIVVGLSMTIPLIWSIYFHGCPLYIQWLLPLEADLLYMFYSH